MRCFINRFAELFATFFYIGKISWAPGTAGSFAGFLLYFCLYDHPLVNFSTFILIFFLGLYSSGRVEKITGKKDPREVVIDEVAGIFVVYFFIPFQWFYLLAGFLLYRLLDIIKPFPIRRIERLGGGLEIMLDDLACGIITNLILQFLWHVCRISLS